MKQPEAAQLFIGNVPRDWTEADLRKLMGTYGDICSLNILKDKVTGQHKGCAFLLYYEKDAAKAAQEELHEKKTLPGSRSAMQVKPADSENKVENRNLFLGMLSRSCDENKLREMFGTYGTIENLTILKHPDGNSKGCGFLKYETRQQAQNAIRAMHNSLTMDGCNKPIVVKLADSDKEKMNKKRAFEDGGPGDSYNSSYGDSRNGASNQYGSNAQSSHMRGAPQDSYGSSNMRTSSYLPDNSQNAMAQLGVGGGALAPLQQSAISQQLLAQMALPQIGQIGQIVAAHPSLFAGHTSAGGGQLAAQQSNQLAGYPSVLSAGGQPAAQGTTMATLLALAQQQQQQQLLLQQQQQQQMQQPSHQATSQGYTSNLSALGANLSNLQQLGAAAGQATQLGGVSTLSGLGAYVNAGAGLGGAGYAAVGGRATATAGAVGDNPYQQQAYSTGIQQYATASYNSPGMKQQGPMRSGSLSGSSARGPEGANLFIYHIPTEYNDSDLMRTFSPYGNVLSAKVFIDKNTGLSKSYGFVNYDSATSAQAAIRALNGFAIGSKRLKVELKKPREDRGKPY